MESLISGPKPSLLGCPFCGAQPHWKLSKVQHDQLHGDPYQYRIIACPQGHAQISRQSNESAAKEWNERGVFSGYMIDSAMNEADELRAEVNILRTEKHADAEAIGALREYAEHKHDCALTDPLDHGIICTCGFDAALKGTDQ